MEIINRFEYEKIRRNDLKFPVPLFFSLKGKKKGGKESKKETGGDGQTVFVRFHLLFKSKGNLKAEVLGATGAKSRGSRIKRPIFLFYMFTLFPFIDSSRRLNMEIEKPGMVKGFGNNGGG